MSGPPPPTGHVWYVSYGSNMSLDRFSCYLRGGTAPGAKRPNQGCRDPSPPLASQRLTIGYPIYFHGESPTWGGGVAFMDHRFDEDDASLARGHLISLEQLGDVLAQEGRRPVGGSVDERIVAALRSGERVTVGDGWYDTLVPLGEVDGHPAVTFTAAWSRHQVTESEPSEVYLASLVTGLLEAWAMSTDDAYRYVRERIAPPP
ncbi:hypothetical protein BH23ACT2_BH23ACT2_02100 [soil metagenome]